MKPRSNPTLTATLLLVFITFCYGSFGARLLMRGPVLTIMNPKAGGTYHEPILTVTGTAQNAVRVVMNGRPVTLDLTGNFVEHITTPRGYTVISIEAENRFGRRVTQTIDVVGTPPATAG